MEDRNNNQRTHKIIIMTPSASQDTKKVEVNIADSLESLDNNNQRTIHEQYLNSREVLTTKDLDAKIDQSQYNWIPGPLQKYAGLIFTLIASLFFSLGVLIVKILGSPEYKFHSYNSSFWRYLGVTIPALPLVAIIQFKQCRNGKQSVFDSVWPLTLNPKNDAEKWMTILGLLTRGLLGASSVILRYFALDYLSIGDTAVITYACPMLVAIMAHFCLGEKLGLVPFIAAIVTFLGVLIMTRPPFLTGEDSFDSQNLIGIGFACGSLICASLIVIITRKIRAVHFSLMTLVFGLVGVIQGFSLSQIFHVFSVPIGLDACGLVLALMVLSFIAQMAIIMALKFEQAGPVSLIRSCDVIFGFLLQFIFLGVAPDILSAVGGIIVLSCVSLTALRKWVASLPEDNNHRKRFRWLLL